MQDNANLVPLSPASAAPIDVGAARAATPADIATARTLVSSVGGSGADKTRVRRIGPHEGVLAVVAHEPRIRVDLTRAADAKAARAALTACLATDLEPGLIASRAARSLLGKRLLPHKTGD